MTGKKANGGETWGNVTVSDSSGGISFGPRSFTRNSAEELYTVNVAKPRTVAGEIISKAGKWIYEKAAEVGKDVLKGYARTVGTYVTDYGRIDVDDSLVPIYRSVITGEYPVWETDQSVLRAITGKNEFVYGAHLDGDSYVYSGLKKNVKKASAEHEITHGLKPHAEEGEVEETAKIYTLYIKENDPDPEMRSEASKVYEGFFDFSTTGRYGGDVVYTTGDRSGRVIKMNTPLDVEVAA